MVYQNTYNPPLKNNGIFSLLKIEIFCNSVSFNFKKNKDSKNELLCKLRQGRVLLVFWLNHQINKNRELIDYVINEEIDDDLSEYIIEIQGRFLII